MKDIYIEMRKVFDSKVLFGILCGIAIFIIALLIFLAGMNVGFHKASFGRNWEENYERNFGMMPNNPVPGRDNFPNAHGAIGKIIKIELPSIIVEDKDKTEKVILIKENTQIQKMRAGITPDNLSVDDFITVIGNPNAQGQIEARFIRVMPLGMPGPGPEILINKK